MQPTRQTLQSQRDQHTHTESIGMKEWSNGTLRRFHSDGLCAGLQHISGGFVAASGWIQSAQSVVMRGAHCKLNGHIAVDSERIL